MVLDRTLELRSEVHRPDAAGRHAAVDLTADSDEGGSVSDRIILVSFQFPVRDALAICNDGDVQVTRNLKPVGLEGIGFSATRHVLIVGLHETLKPLTHGRERILLLSVVASWSRDR